jgi:hypothetical protein
MKYIIKCVSLAIILLLVQITIASCNNENTETPSKTDENPDFEYILKAMMNRCCTML